MEFLELRCLASTDDSTPLNYIWYRHEKEEHAKLAERIYHSTDERITIITDQTSGESILTIDLRDVQDRDLRKFYAGYYRCEANNTYSNDTCTAQFILPYKEPAGKKTFTHI